MKRRMWMFAAVGVLAALAAFGQQPLEYYLTGNLREVPGTVTTDKGDQRTTFFGSIGFRVVPTEKGLLFYLIDFNLISKGVLTSQGESGVLGVSLAVDPQPPSIYDPKTGRASWEFRAILHYELIDRVKGFRKVEVKGENDAFVPFTERLKGKLSGRFPEALKVADKGSTTFDGEIVFDLTDAELGVVRRITLAARFVIDWTRLRAPAQFLKIQPVFIGTGPADPTATGTAFPTLMARAHELWNKCGTVRCIRFVVNTPIYLNKPAYRVLDSDAEITRLLAEVSEADAVEVFVVERLATCDLIGGGGACWFPGTASAKIVTSDQQLSVPCPCPVACRTFCPCGGCGTSPATCGAVNYYHLAHELGHALNLDHPGRPYGLADVTAGSNMEPSGFCCDNPNIQSAKNCRNAANPLLYWGTALCVGKPDILD